MAVVALRPVEDGDLDALFEQLRDPEGVRMAAFTPEDPTTGAPSTRTWPGCGRRRTSPSRGDLRRRAGGQHRQLPHRGPDRDHLLDRPRRLGPGIATRALALLLDLVPDRPVYARAASDNAGSLRVLHKSGFTAIGTEISFARAERGHRGDHPRLDS